MTNKEVHITHCISLESSNNSHSFGDMLNDSKYINKEKDIDNLYIEDTQHKYDQNILTFINKRKRGRYPNSLNSHSCSKLISFLQFQQEAPSTKKIPLKVANSERIEFIDGKITMNQLNISNKNSESDLLVEDEGNLFSREFEFDYKAKDQLKICGYYGGIEGKKYEIIYGCRNRLRFTRILLRELYVQKEEKRVQNRSGVRYFIRKATTS